MFSLTLPVSSSSIVKKPALKALSFNALTTRQLSKYIGLHGANLILNVRLCIS